MVTDSNPEGSLDQLRQILLHEQQNEIEILQGRLAALEDRIVNTDKRTSLVGEVLPQALRESGGADSHLQVALQPEVEDVISRSVRQHPTVLAEAIYPLLGPAFRKMIERLFSRPDNETLKPYNVEQLFLIHRKTGLVICHQADPNVVTQDADMVSGMLDAIRSFVQDAFGAHEFDGLEQLTVGEVNVRIEWSPQAVLAAVVRGIEPASLQPALESALHEIHTTHEIQLAQFKGDSSELEIIDNDLRMLNESLTSSDNIPFWKQHFKSLCFFAALVALVITGIKFKEDRRWNKAIDELSAEPGIIIIANNRGWGNMQISGMLDIDAVEPEAILTAHGFDIDNIDRLWEQFVSSEPAIKQSRALRVLGPPPGVGLEIDNRHLIVSGDVSDEWILQARSLLPSLDGVDSLDRGNLKEQ